MIFGTGIDVVKINRVDEKLAERILGKHEKGEYEKVKDKKTFLASRFAVKEAFFKAFGSGIRNSSLQDIEVVHNKLGKPLLMFHRDFEGFNFAHVTISHDFVAVAQVTLEKRHGGVYIGIGSNLGNRLRNISDACLLLERYSVQVIGKSAIYETKPYGRTNQPDFLNCVIEIETKLPPQRLLSHLFEVERQLGRVRTEKWGPRTIDLDILLYGNLVFESNELVVPHYDLLNRSFFVMPLAELGVKEHPIEGDLLKHLKEGEECKLLTKNW